MKSMKLALIGTAALAALSVSARADDLSVLKDQMNSLTINAAADVPAAPAASVVWNGYVRAGVEGGYNPANAAGQQYAADVRGYGEIKVTAKTATAVGEVGVAYQIQSGGGAFGANSNGNTFGGTNGSAGGSMTTDDIVGYWHATPNLTVQGGINGSNAKNTYAWDTVATNWWAASTGGNFLSGPFNNDPAFWGIAYADGPMGFAVTVEDGNNANNVSSFGATGKLTYKMDAIGFDLSGGYWGNAGGCTNVAYCGAAYNVDLGLGYAAGPLTFGVVGGYAQFASQAQAPEATAFIKLKASDAARIELGATHDFGTSIADANSGATVFGAGIYYQPVAQLTVGLEGGYITGGQTVAAANTGANTAVTSPNGTYNFAVATQFSF